MTKSKYWFWVWNILVTSRKDVDRDTENLSEVWKNLIIVSANNAEEAIRKATDIGKNEEGDSSGTLRLDGFPAFTKYIGIEDMGLIHDDLSDGAEILWRLERCKTNALPAPKPFDNLILELKKELDQKSI